MAELTLEQLKQQVARLTLEKAEQFNTISIQALEMRDIALVTKMPVPAWNDKPPYWTMEFLAEWVTLHVKALTAQRDAMQKQRDQLYGELMDARSAVK